MKFHAFIRSVTIQLKIGHKGLDYVTSTEDICGIMTTPDSTTEAIAPQDTNNELCDTELCDTEPSYAWDHSVVYQNATSSMDNSETLSKKIQTGPVYTEEEQIT